MLRTRLTIAIVGVLLPYVARIPGMLLHGPSWLRSYTSAGVAGFAFIQSFNIVGWGTLVGLSFLVRKPRAIFLPTVAGLGFVGFAHAVIDLAADPQNPVALVFIPIYAFPIILVTFVVSLATVGRGTLDRVPSKPNVRPPVGPVSPNQCPGCGAPVTFGSSHCKVCEHPLSSKRGPASNQEGDT